MVVVCEYYKHNNAHSIENTKHNTTHTHTHTKGNDLKYETNIKAMQITATTQKRHPTPEDFLPSEPPALRSTSHTPAQVRLARSLARTTQTRNETETDFPIRGLLR